VSAPSPSSPPPRDHVLDNVVWHALTGPLARFAEAAPGEGGARPAALRFDPEVGVFAAVEHVGPAAWAALARLVGPGGQCVLVRERVPAPPPGWEETFRGSILQLVARALPPRRSFAWQVLGPDDGPEMLALAQLTEPGPYRPRTRELGRYIGVRRDGRFVAMAGERFRVPGYTEVSAVCTHPDVRGEGLGGALTLEIAHGIRERGEEAFLHVMADNVPALRLYEKLGFERRWQGEVLAAVWHDDGLPSDAPRDPGD
jgi:ribosomal protein S18 acetylase RimI-like enzyme